MLSATTFAGSEALIVTGEVTVAPGSVQVTVNVYVGFVLGAEAPASTFLSVMLEGSKLLVNATAAAAAPAGLRVALVLAPLTLLVVLVAPLASVSVIVQFVPTVTLVATVTTFCEGDTFTVFPSG